MLKIDSKDIENLITIQDTIHEIDCAIFMRKNREILEKACDNFNQLIIETYSKCNIGKDEITEEKNNLYEKFKKIVTEFIVETESLYAYALERIENCEMNQNTLFLKLRAIDFLNQGKDKIDFENDMIKKQICRKKIDRYNKIISYCKRELEVSSKTIEVEISKYYFKDINFVSTRKALLPKDKKQLVKSEVFEYFNKYLDEFYENIVIKDIENVRLYTIIFDKDMEKLQSKIMNS